MRVKIGRQTWRLDGKWSLLSLLLLLVVGVGDWWVSRFDASADKTYWLPGGRAGGSEVGPAEFFYTLLVLVPCCVVTAIIFKKDGWPWLRRLRQRPDDGS